MSQNKKNVLLIMCDQLRKNALGIYHNKKVQTPNIDALFEKGTLFSNMFAAHPVCAPNRGAIATGRWPKVNGLVFNAYVLPETETTMMDVFRENGYLTYGIGKMHFSPQWENDWDEKGKGAINPQPKPQEMPHYGFDFCAITEDQRVGPYAEYLKKHGYSEWEDDHSFTFPQNRCISSPYPEEHHQTTWITDRSIKFLKKHDKSKPFFMWTSFVDPHHPFNPPKPFDTLYHPDEMPLPLYKEGEHELRPRCYMNEFTGSNKNHCQLDSRKMKDSDWQKTIALYYGMISLIDKNIGKLVDYLKSIGEYKNTIFVFTSDHGELLGDHHLLYKSFPFDCVTSVPFLVKTPEMKQRHHCDILCQSLDIMPTILDLAGIEYQLPLNGKSLHKHVTRKTNEELNEEILIEQYVHHTIRSKKYRLSIFHNFAKGELYDLENDPENFHNLWSEPEYQDIKDGLISKLVKKMYKEVVDPRFKKHGKC